MCLLFRSLSAVPIIIIIIRLIISRRVFPLLVVLLLPAAALLVMFLGNNGVSSLAASESNYPSFALSGLGPLDVEHTRGIHPSFTHCLCVSFVLSH
jgi:hypothetical protein